VLLSGSVLLVLENAEARAMIIGIVQAPECFGELSLFDIIDDIYSHRVPRELCNRVHPSRDRVCLDEAQL
jgi:CRP-like cAMP-binding protein